MKRSKLTLICDEGNGLEMTSKKQDENWLRISARALEENDEDRGYMFCEDCRHWHAISYSQAFDDNHEKVNWILVGCYECNENRHLWSINGKRVD